MCRKAGGGNGLCAEPGLVQLPPVPVSASLLPDGHFADFDTMTDRLLDEIIQHIQLYNLHIEN